jgi:hypothetical protein
MGGPKVFVVSTLASSKPAAPFIFRNYELPDEAAPLAEQLAACAGSCKHHVWEVSAAGWAAGCYLGSLPDAVSVGALRRHGCRCHAACQAVRASSAAPYYFGGCPGGLCAVLYSAVRLRRA